MIQCVCEDSTIGETQVSNFVPGSSFFTVTGLKHNWAMKEERRKRSEKKRERI